MSSFCLNERGLMIKIENASIILHIGFAFECCYGNVTAGCINRYNPVAMLITQKGKIYLQFSK